MPKKRHYTPAPSGRSWAQTGRLADVKVRPLTAAEKQKRANIEADRLAAARRAARPKKPPVVVKPKTPGQRAGERRESWMMKVPGLRQLHEALKPKKKKSRRKR